MTFFDSDYMEGAHPEVMRQLMATNLEHTVGYGKDHYCDEARDLIRKACNAPDALVHFSWVALRPMRPLLMAF